jgi:hypothetical protein
VILFTIPTIETGALLLTAAVAGGGFLGLTGIVVSYLFRR